MSADIQSIREQALQRLDSLNSIEEATTWEADYLGPKGAVKLFQRSLGSLSAEERPAAGRAANDLSKELAEKFAPIKERLESTLR